MRRTHSITVFTALAAILLASIGPLSATVLCEGLDGHVEIETSFGGVCGTEARRHAETTTATEDVYTATGAGDHCGPCVDVPLDLSSSKGLTVATQDTRSEDKDCSSVLRLTMTASPSSHASYFASSGYGFSASPTLVNLRTVTLLV